METELLASGNAALAALIMLTGLFLIYMQHKAVADKQEEIANRPVPPESILEPLAAGPLSGKKIVVDPGHGDHDSGATNGPAVEKNINLSVGLRLADLLRARGATVIMTRDDDTFIPLDERAAISNRNKCDLFISVHTNSNDTPSVHGIETYYYSDESEEYAKHMFDALVSGTGDKPNFTHQRSLRVLSQNKRIAVLTEHGYLSYTATRDLLITEEYQQRIAESLLAGIVKTLAGHVAG